MPSPSWKTYRDGKYVAAFKYPEDAVAFVSITGGEVRWGHNKQQVMWREAEFDEHRSYQHAAETMLERLADLQRKLFTNTYGRQP